MSDLDPLNAYCSALLNKTGSSERRKLAREIAASIRSSQAKRIAAQKNPDGSDFAPRKPQKFRGRQGRIRRTMFARLRTSKFLKTEASPESAVVTFSNEVQRIANVHQHGLRDKVNRRRNLEADYPERKLLGITRADISLVEDIVISHLSR